MMAVKEAGRQRPCPEHRHAARRYLGRPGSPSPRGRLSRRAGGQTLDAEEVARPPVEVAVLGISAASANDGAHWGAPVVSHTNGAVWE